VGYRRRIRMLRWVRLLLLFQVLWSVRPVHHSSSSSSIPSPCSTWVQADRERTRYPIGTRVLVLRSKEECKLPLGGLVAIQYLLCTPTIRIHTTIPVQG